MDWWETFFDSPRWQEVQLGWAAVEDAGDQAERIERALGLWRGARVLDAPCGAGRIAIELASRGCRVTGIDTVERFLDAGRERAAGRGAEVTFVRGDVREPAGDAAFDAAVCFWGSFGYFDDGGNLAQARAAARALVPGGKYLLDLPTAETVRAHPRPEDGFRVGEIEVRMASAVVGPRVETEWTFAGPGRAPETLRSSVRLFTLPELTDLLREAGFSSFEARDDALQPFTSESERLWLVAARDG